MKKLGLHSCLKGGVILTLLCGAVAYGEVNYTFAEGDAFDNAEIGATMTRSNDTVPAYAVKLTSWDILASTTEADLASMKSARNDGSKHKTNFKEEALGIDNIFVSGDESARFKKAETWVVKFDQDVYLTSFDLYGMTGGFAAMELYVADIKQFTFSGNDPQSDYAARGKYNRVYKVEPILVPKDAEVAFACIAGGSMRIHTISIKAASPKLETLGLIIRY